MRKERMEGRTYHDKDLWDWVEDGKGQGLSRGEAFDMG